MIEKSLVDRVRDALDLRELVSESVPLDSKGYAPCPFHEEDTPSFHVEPKFFKCFGCGKRGDAFQWASEALGAEHFPAAVRMIAERVGIEVPDDRQKKRAGSDSPNFEQRWERLAAERSWSERYSLDPELSRTYLRSGRRTRKDPVSESVVGLWVDGKLHGAKFRLPPGERWHDFKPPTSPKLLAAKYKLWAKTKAADLVLGLDRAQLGATLVLCAGEKDWLVASSHLDPRKWAPITGCAGEGTIPRDLGKRTRGRELVVAYDGDEAGRTGALAVALAVPGAKVAPFPEGKDVADVWEEGGARALEALLLEAEVVEVEAPVEVPKEDTGRPVIVDELADWRIVAGEVCELVQPRGAGRKNEPPEPHVRFRGVVRVAEERVELREEPADPTGWARRTTFVYEVTPQGRGGPPDVLERPAGVAHFGALLDQNYVREAAVYDTRTRAKLYRFARAASRPRRTTLREALGYHGPEIGWVCAPRTRVAGGEVLEAAESIAHPPGGVFAKYRLEDLSDARAAEVARFVVDVLLQCDRSRGALCLPLLGAYMSGPLFELLPDLEGWQRYAAFLQGTSGIGKSHLSRRFWSFWGDFTSPEGLPSWSSTATSLEALLHYPVGVPLYVGDWKLSNLVGHDLTRAMRFLQNYADRTARARCHSTAELRASRPPRCQLVIDGEDLPSGEQSTMGRLFVIPAKRSEEPDGWCARTDHFPPGLVRDLPGLTSRWIAYVQRNADRLQGYLPDLVDEVSGSVADLQTANKSRIARSAAANALAVAGVLDLCRELGADVSTVSRLELRSLEVHGKHLRAQVQSTEEESAGGQFLAGLSAVLRGGAGFLDKASPHVHELPFGQPTGSAARLGVYDEDTVHLWQDVALPTVQRFLTQGGGDRIKFSARAIRDQLAESGDLVGSSRRRTEGGGRPRVWILRRGAVA